MSVGVSRIYATLAITEPQGEIAQNINRIAAAQVHGGVGM
jgi:hypothetical protein